MKKNEDAAAKKKPKTSAAQLRVQKGACAATMCLGWASLTRHVSSFAWSLDITELDLPSTMKTHFPNPDDLLNFVLTIKPDEGG